MPMRYDLLPHVCLIAMTMFVFLSSYYEVYNSQIFNEGKTNFEIIATNFNFIGYTNYPEMAIRGIMARPY